MNIKELNTLQAEVEKARGEVNIILFPTKECKDQFMDYFRKHKKEMLVK